MTNEQGYMLDAIRAYFNKYQLNNSCMSLDALYELSRAHNLSSVVFSAIKDIPSYKEQERAYRAFENDFFDSVVRYDYQSAAINDISDILSKAKIRHVFFKGAEIRDYFPVPELRSMGDIDLLISKSHRATVKELLCENGFELINSNGPVWDYKRDNALVEVHTQIVNGKIGSLDLEEHFQDAIEHSVFDGYKGHLEPKYHLEYLLAHIAHHFWFYGAGVKMILDLAVMLDKFDFDPDDVQGDMDKLGLGEFTKIIFTICKKWFDVGKEYNVDSQKTEEFLLSFGAFGNKDRNKSAVIVRKALEEGKDGGLATKLQLAFPSYKKMKNIPYMTFMEGRPYLLPLGWIYRGIYNLKNRKSFLKESLSSIDSDETRQEAQRELEYFEEIGLV